MMKMRKIILILSVAFCTLSFSSCITMMLLENATKDSAFDDRGVTNSVFSVANDKTVRFARANLFGQDVDHSEISKRYGKEKYGTGWSFERNSLYGDGSGAYDKASGRYMYGECNNVRILCKGQIVSGYRLLTAEEWAYLLFKRSASTVGGVENARFVIAQVELKRGIILFPDRYKHPRGVPEIYGANDCEGRSLDNSLNENEWSKMEDAGAVFLREPCTNALCPRGYLTSSKNSDGEVGLMCFSSLVSHYVGIKFLPSNSKGLARLVLDD